LIVQPFPPGRLPRRPRPDTAESSRRTGDPPEHRGESAQPRGRAHLPARTRQL